MKDLHLDISSCVLDFILSGSMEPNLVRLVVNLSLGWGTKWIRADKLLPVSLVYGKDTDGVVEAIRVNRDLFVIRKEDKRRENGPV